MKTLTLLLAALFLAVLGTTAAHASVAQPAHVKTQVSKNGCHYSGHLQPLGVHTANVVITKDSCSRNMRSFAYCFQPVAPGLFHAVSGWARRVGTVMHATCAHLDDGVFYAGYQYVYYKCVPGGLPGTCFTKKEIGTYGLYGSP